MKKHKPIRWENYVTPAASTVSEASVNFSFASPAPEDVSNGTMEGVSDPQPSPENLRQHQENQSTLNISHDEDVVRDDATEASLVLFEEKDTVYEETVSPGLDPDDNTDAETNEDLEEDHAMTWPVNQELLNPETQEFPLDIDSYRDAYRTASIKAKQWQIPLSEGIVQSKWHRDNWDKIRIGEAPLQKIVDFEEINSDYFWNKLVLEREARFSLAEINLEFNLSPRAPVGSSRV